MALGAVANHGVNATSITTVDNSYTVGTISLTNNSANSWNFRTATGTGAQSITLNQDGAGAGAATISNTNTFAGTGNSLSFGAASVPTLTLMLADNLNIINTSLSTAAPGAIQFSTNSTIAGMGNITISNANNAVSGFVNSVRFTTNNSFTGNVNIVKGFVSFSPGDAFGTLDSNLITIGSSGESATLLASASNTVSNNWAVAAGSGTVIMGSTFAGGGGNTFSGTGTLNSDLTFSAESTGVNYTNLSGVISGTGGIIKQGSGQGRLNAANTYTGDTKVTAGTLTLNNALALQNSAMDTTGAGGSNTFILASGITTPTFGGLKGNVDLATAISSGYSAVTSLTLNPTTGASATNTYSGVIADGAVGMTLDQDRRGHTNPLRREHLHRPDNCNRWHAGNIRKPERDPSREPDGRHPAPRRFGPDQR